MQVWKDQGETKEKLLFDCCKLKSAKTEKKNKAVKRKKQSCRNGFLVSNMFCTFYIKFASLCVYTFQNLGFRFLDPSAKLWWNSIVWVSPLSFLNIRTWTGGHGWLVHPEPGAYVPPSVQSLTGPPTPMANHANQGGWSARSIVLTRKHEQGTWKWQQPKCGARAVRRWNWQRWLPGVKQYALPLLGAYVASLWLKDSTK